jgi:two-component system, NarL family, nitrate/nitrite response regulator NarL
MIVLATSSAALLDHYQKYLQPFGMVISVNDVPTLRRALTKIKPRLLFMDVGMLDSGRPHCIAQLRALSQNTTIVGLGSALPEEQELELFCAGMRAYCLPGMDFHQFKKMITALHHGEVWLSRAKMARLLARLHTSQPMPQVKPAQSTSETLWTLTQREKEIALLIASGNNNRQIAMALNISERTVKAHLTEIFRKLGLTDRLALAVKITSSARLKTQATPVTTVTLDPDTIGFTS